MPNLPKPRLRRSARAGRLVAPPPEKERKPQVETITAEGLRWVNIESPSPLECAWLEEQFGFHALDLEDVLSRNSARRSTSTRTTCSSSSTSRSSTAPWGA